MADGSYARAEQLFPGDYNTMRLAEEGRPKGAGPFVRRDKSAPGGPAYFRLPDDARPGLAGGGGRQPPTMLVPPGKGYDPHLGLNNKKDAAGNPVPFESGSYGKELEQKPQLSNGKPDSSGWETDHFPPYSSYQSDKKPNPYAFVAETRMPAVNLPKGL